MKYLIPAARRLLSTLFGLLLVLWARPAGAGYGATPVADFPTNYVSLTTTLAEYAAGQNLTYQWYFNGSAIVNATTSQLVLTALTAGSNGVYSVCLTSSVAGAYTNPPGVAVTVWPIPTNAAQLNLTNGLVLHLPLVNDCNDISGRSNNGTAVGSPTVGAHADAQVGGGYLTYSSTAGGPYNYVTLGTPSDLVFGAAGNFSVAFWVRYTGTQGKVPFLANQVGSLNSTSQGVTLGPDDGSGSWAWSMLDNNGSGSGAVGTTAINDGHWHHLVYVFNRASSATTYLDGMLPDTRPDFFFFGVDSGQTFNIGQDPTGAFSATGGANLADLGVWRRTLTQLEISGIYLAGLSNSPGVSFAPASANPPVGVSLQVTTNGLGQWSLVWTGTGKLQASGEAGSGYTNLLPPVTTSPYLLPMTAARMFYRLK
jgi:Concanavalin A-like lectin/glucanases superfamily